MKKNIMMRVAGGVLVATLLSTSIISGTFAKYVTRGEVADQARVAKFGVKVLGSGSLFDVTYHNVDEGNGPTGGVKNDGEEWVMYTIESSNGDNLVAPGAKNEEGLSIAITGKPETDVRVTFEFTATEDVFLAAKDGLPNMTTGDKKDTFDNAEDYYPIVYTLSGEYIAERIEDLEELEGVTVGEDGASVSGNLDAIAAVFNALNNDDEGVYVDANTNLAKAIGTLTLTWEWAFENDVENVDEMDTLLGDLAAGTNLNPATELEAGVDYNLDVILSLTVTVTQVD